MTIKIKGKTVSDDIKKYKGYNAKKVKYFKNHLNEVINSYNTEKIIKYITID